MQSAVILWLSSYAANMTIRILIAYSLYGGSRRITINQRLGLLRKQINQYLPLGSGVALDMKFGIDLIHILLDAALREK